MVAFATTSMKKRPKVDTFQRAILDRACINIVLNFDKEISYLQNTSGDEKKSFQLMSCESCFLTSVQQFGLLYDVLLVLLLLLQQDSFGRVDTIGLSIFRFFFL
jgi:hypothetical protein